MWEDVKTTCNPEEERVPAKDARGWKIEGHKRRVTRKEYKRLHEKFEVGRSCLLAKKRMLEYRGTQTKEDRNGKVK